MAAATAHALYGQGAITVAIISKASSVSELLELLVLLKEAGLYRPGHEPGATIMPVPLFETIDDMEAAPQVRSDERSVGTECDSMCRSQWSPSNSKKQLKDTLTID